MKDPFKIPSERIVKTPDFNPFLTVFTPTFNRAHTLTDVYESLCEQTCEDFEWLIVDDGSSDETRELVKKWISENRLAIRYQYQENAGKHIAWNHAVQVAQGQYFLCLDSDDRFLKETVESIRQLIQNEPESDKPVSALAFLLMNRKGEPYGKDLSQLDLRKNYTELTYQAKLPSDIWIVFLLNHLRETLFPETYRNIYFPESYLILAYDRRFSISLFTNQRLGIYQRDVSDLNSLTQVGTIANLNNGSSINLAMINLGHLQFCPEMLWKYPKKFLRRAVNYVRFRLHTPDCSSTILREIRPNSSKIVATFALPLGLFLYLNDRRKLQRSHPHRH